MFKYFMAFGMLVYSVSSLAQTLSVRGTVFDKEARKSLPGVNVYWRNTTKGTTTDSDGNFIIPADSLPKYLMFSYVGYSPDSLMITGEQDVKMYLKSTIEIKTVEVSETRGAFTMSAADKLNTEEINRGVLRKAACCNLSESFETSASVDVVFNDAVSGTRKIQMLGLEGKYVQNLFEGIPFSRGLGNVLGFDQIPGSWLSAIQLTKGSGSVQNGYESMTGQINLEFLPPDAPRSLYADVFANSQGRYEGNVIANTPISDKWSTSIFIGGNSQQQRVDNNDDGFLDMPLREGYNLMNRWKYKGDFVRSQIILKAMEEDRNGGQQDFDFSNDYGTTNAYGIGINVRQYEVLAKTGILSKNRGDRSLGLTGIVSRTNVDSYFGLNSYEGEETTLRFNSLFSTKFSEYSDHSFVTGFHFLYDEYQEVFRDSVFSRIERVPGAHFEYTYLRPRFTAVAGVRTDWHNMFGWQVSPRLHLKYNLKPLSVLRATIGKGFRTPNAIADQIGLLASSRNVNLSYNLRAEESWNTGISFLHKFELFNREAVLTTDYYLTWFENQLVVDRDTDVEQLQFYNLNGNSFANSFQAELQFQPIKMLGFKVAYKFQDVQTDYRVGRRLVPLIPRHRVLVNLGYSWDEDHWIADFTINYFGTSRLPSTEANPPEYRLRDESEPYALMNAQITRVFGPLEVYIGSENIANFIQPNAILDPENPFGTEFDATLIYGPVNGRTIYFGLRLNLNVQKK